MRKRGNLGIFFPSQFNHMTDKPWEHFKSLYADFFAYIQLECFDEVTESFFS